jgi:hypothetical protein
MLALIALNSTIYSFLRCLAVGDRIELRSFARSSRPTPVNHVPVVAAVRVQSQHVICEESPALSVGGHLVNLPVAVLTL